MKKILKFLNIFTRKYFLILLGFILIIAYFWLRFIRERLPKDIPFSLSQGGFITLLYICCIYAYIVISYLRSSSIQTNTLNTFINILYKPLEDFDYFWKHLSFIESPYKKFALWLVYKLDFFIIHTNLFYFIFAILPRLLLILIFSIDIFWFYKLYYIYKVLFLGIFLFLNRYIIYSLKMLKKDLTNDFKLNYLVDISTKYEFGIHPSEYPENYDPDDPDNDDIPENMALSIDVFVDYYIDNYVYKNKKISYSSAGNYQESFYDKIYEKYNLEKTRDGSSIPYKISKQYRKETYDLIKMILDTGLLIEYYDVTNTQNKVYKYTKIAIFSSYLFCWLYILVLSTSKDNILEILNLLYKIASKNIEEPFSGLFF